jgi:hypothetical protein
MNDYWDASAPSANPTLELIALALARRRDWSDLHITSAIEAAVREGMTWDQIAVGLVRLMVDPKASPRELVPDSRTPLGRERYDPAVAREGAATCRELLAALRAGRTAAA